MKKLLYLLLPLCLFAGGMWLWGNRTAAPAYDPWLEKALTAAAVDERIFYLNQSIFHGPAATTAYLLRGRAYTQKSRTGFDPLGTERLRYLNKARADFDQVLKAEPDNPLALACLGDLDLVSAPDRGSAELDRALEQAPENEEILLLKARLLAARGKIPSGLEILDALLHREPQNVGARLLKARLLRRQGNVSRALEEYSQILVQAPQNTEVFVARADLFRTSHREQEALADLNAAIELDPKRPSLFRLRATLLTGLGEPEQAAADRLKADDLDPNHWFEIGLFSEPETAYSALSRAIGLNPWNPDYYVLRGKISAQLGRREEGRSDFAKAMDLDPGLAVAYLFDGQLLEEMGQGDQALARYQQACQAGDCAAYRQAVMTRQKPLDEEFWRQVFAGQVPARDIIKRYAQKVPERWEIGIVRDLLSRINGQAYQREEAPRIETPVQKALLRLFDEETGIPGLVAAYPQVDASLLATLAKSDHEQTLSGVARNPRTPQPVLLALSERPNDLIARNLARNASLPDQALLRLVKNDSIEIAREARLNPRVQHAAEGEATLELVKEIYALRAPFSEDWRYRNEGEGRNLSKGVRIKARTRLLLAEDVGEQVRTWVARDSQTSSELLDRMASDVSETVLGWVFLNNNCASKTRERIVPRLVAPAENAVQQLYRRLAQSGSPELRAAVAANRQLPAEVATLLAKDCSDAVLVALIHNPRVPVGCLKRLASNTSAEVQKALASHRGLAPDVLRGLAKGSVEVRQALAANPRTPSDVLASFARDPDRYVRGISAQTRKMLGRVQAYQAERNTLPARLSSSADPEADAALPAAERVRLIEDLCKLLSEDSPYFYQLWAADPSFRYEAGNQAWEAAAEDRLRLWYRALGNLRSLILHSEVDLDRATGLLSLVSSSLTQITGSGGGCQALIRVEEAKQDFLLNVWPRALQLEADPPADRVSTYQINWMNELLEAALKSFDGEFSAADFDFLRRALEVSQVVPYPSYQMTGFLERTPPGRIPDAEFIGFLRELSRSEHPVMQLYGRYGLFRRHQEQQSDLQYLAEASALLQLCRRFGKGYPPPRSNLEFLLKHKKFAMSRAQVKP